MPQVKWKIRGLLQEKRVTVQALLEAMGGGREATLYRITSPTSPPTRVDLPTLEAIITALRKITNEDIGVGDLIEYDSSEHQKPLGRGQ